MKRHRTNILALAGAALAAVLLALPVAPAAASDANCLSSWTQASSLARTEKLASASDVLKRAKSRIKGKVLSISLCERSGQFSYKLIYHDAEGRVRNLMVDARKPFGSR